MLDLKLLMKEEFDLLANKYRLKRVIDIVSKLDNGAPSVLGYDYKFVWEIGTMLRSRASISSFSRALV